MPKRGKDAQTDVGENLGYWDRRFAIKADNIKNVNLGIWKLNFDPLFYLLFHWKSRKLITNLLSLQNKLAKLAKLHKNTPCQLFYFPTLINFMSELDHLKTSKVNNYPVSYEVDVDGEELPCFSQSLFDDSRIGRHRQNPKL